MISLPQDQIHLWLVFEEEVKDAHLAKYFVLLSEKERQQAKKFHFAKDRRRYLITRALVRTALSRYTGHVPDYWQFERDEYGRPVLLNEDPFADAVSFNISHADGLIIFGVVHHCAVGVDVENLQRETSYLDMADCSFSPIETAALRALPAYAWPERFFHYWTLKEAYAKAVGKGLSIPFKQLSFDFVDTNTSRILFHALPGDFPSGCQFWLLQPSQQHVAAICVGQTDKFRHHLKMIKSVPLYQEEIYECSVYAQFQSEPYHDIKLT